MSICSTPVLCVRKPGDGGAALAVLAQGGIDLLILDIMMPFMDGMTCLREMRTRKIMTPVIMLTARSEEYDKLAGLEGGADDYVVKPFSPRELVARVKAVLARTMPKPAENSGVFTFGDLVIDTASHSVKVAGQEAPLTPKEFDLLVFLVNNKGIALSREKIFAAGVGTTIITARTAPWTPTSNAARHLGPAANSSLPCGASGINSTEVLSRSAAL